jgi:sugar lactone lactonase YvrE
MVVDGAGRAYVGSFGFDRHRGEPERTTCIARVDPDGALTRAADDLLFRMARSSLRTARC